MCIVHFAPSRQRKEGGDVSELENSDDAASSLDTILLCRTDSYVRILQRGSTKHFFVPSPLLPACCLLQRMVSMTTTKTAVLGAACLIGQCEPFTPSALSAVHRQKRVALAAASSAPSIVDVITERHHESRRSFLACSFVATLGIITPFVGPNTVIASEGKLQSILFQIKEGREQLECVPDLIKAEKWDGGKYFSQIRNYLPMFFISSSNFVRHPYLVYHSARCLV